MGLLSGIGKALFGDPSKDIKRGTEAQLKGQRQALQYLKQQDAPYLKYRSPALQQLAGFYGLGGPEGMDAQRAFIEQTMRNPLYQQQQALGEEAILRQQAATGGLRSGTTQQNLAALNTQMLQDAVNQQLRGLEYFSQPAAQAGNIANLYQGMGQTAGQGAIAAGQAKQDQLGQLLNVGASAAMIAASDIRLKDNIERIGDYKGYNVYRWTWNAAGEALGYTGEAVGVMAHELDKVRPDLVSERNGYLHVNYGGLFDG